MNPRDIDAAPAGEAVRPAFAVDAASVGKWSVEAVYYALVLLIPIETISTIKDADGSTVAYPRLVGMLLFALALVNRRICFRRIPAAFWLIAWYLAVFSLSQLWIPAEVEARFLEERMTLMQMLGLFLISTNMFSDAAFRGRLLRFYGWWVALVAVGMLLGAFGRTAFVDGRETILGQDPNAAAIYYALGALCLAGDARIFAASRGVLGRIVAALIAVSGLILAIMQTGSRGGMLVLLTGFVGLAACGTRATRGKRVLIAGAVLVLLGAAIVWQFQQVTPTAVRLNNAWVNGDTAGRTRIYDAAWNMFLKKPLLGYGGANNTFRLGAELAYASGKNYYRDTHNLLLAVLTEVGLVGAIPFLAAIALVMWKGWRHGRRTGDALPFALMCGQLSATVSLTWYHNQKLFWIFLAAAAACGLEAGDGDAAVPETETETETETEAL